MIDICQHCIHLGDFKVCEQNGCYIPSVAYVLDLRLKLRAAQEEIEYLRKNFVGVFVNNA